MKSPEDYGSSLAPGRELVGAVVIGSIWSSMSGGSSSFGVVFSI